MPSPLNHLAACTVLSRSRGPSRAVLSPPLEGALVGPLTCVASSAVAADELTVSCRACRCRLDSKLAGSTEGSTEGSRGSPEGSTEGSRAAVQVGRTRRSLCTSSRRHSGTAESSALARMQAHVLSSGALFPTTCLHRRETVHTFKGQHRSGHSGGGGVATVLPVQAL